MSAYRSPGSVPDQVPNLRFMLHDSENRTYVKQIAPWAKEKACNNNLLKSGPRVPLTQGEISGKLHTAELSRVGAADRHQVPKAWNKSQGCLGGESVKKNATYSSLFVFQFFTCPEQTARYDCSFPPLAPVKFYVHSKSAPFGHSCLLFSTKVTCWVIPSRDLKYPCFHEKLPEQTFIYC